MSNYSAHVQEATISREGSPDTGDTFAVTSPQGADMWRRWHCVCHDAQNALAHPKDRRVMSRENVCQFSYACVHFDKI